MIKVRGDPVIAGAKYGTMHQHYVQESHRRARQRLLTKTDAFQSLAASESTYSVLSCVLCGILPPAGVL